MRTAALIPCESLVVGFAFCILFRCDVWRVVLFFYIVTVIFFVCLSIPYGFTLRYVASRRAYHPGVLCCTHSSHVWDSLASLSPRGGPSGGRALKAIGRFALASRGGRHTLRGVVEITPRRSFRRKNIDHARTGRPDVSALATFTVPQSALRAGLCGTVNKREPPVPKGKSKPTTTRASAT